MVDDDFVPKSIPGGRREEERREPEPTLPPAHPLFVKPQTVDVNVTRTKPATSIYDWSPGFRGSRLRVKGGTGDAQLTNPAAFFSMFEGGRLTGAAEEDARNLNEIAREYLQAIGVSERETKKNFKDVLERIEKKETTLPAAQAELGMAPPPVEEGQVLQPEPESEVIPESLMDGPEPDPVRREHTEAELDAALNDASVSEKDYTSYDESFLDFDDEPEPPPAPKPKKKTRKKRSKKL